jgi:hypothetical protein
MWFGVGVSVRRATCRGYRGDWQARWHANVGLTAGADKRRAGALLRRGGGRGVAYALLAVLLCERIHAGVMSSGVPAVWQCVYLMMSLMQHGRIGRGS